MWRLRCTISYQTGAKYLKTSRLFWAILHYFGLFCDMLGYFEKKEFLFCKTSSSDEKHYLHNFRGLKKSPYLKKNQ